MAFTFGDIHLEQWTVPVDQRLRQADVSTTFNLSTGSSLVAAPTAPSDGTIGTARQTEAVTGDR